ncbi:hypothetical protein L1994_02350 [Methanomicrobium antiquum]|uniref:Uncharacterized protein n=1 Tax=Methanomicrobium antiquum TaxID=487686 RepID=A0AAF0FXP5_9EURY|nr:hypothetical protein [Methanomicrobium antiquum]WFN37955.1 hypothetical protein L1994_02350 [Methanomicrobium antiquum]
MIEKTLSVLFEPESVIEVRAIGDFAAHSGYFDDHSLLAAKAWMVGRLSDVSGVYVTLNEINPDLLSRRANRIRMKLSKKDATTADSDIIRRRWLPVDLDPVRPSGVSSSDAEHKLALEKAASIREWLSEEGFSEPVLADSGNGAHLLYRIDLENNQESAELVKRCLEMLDTFFSDTSVCVDTANFNAARIWKLYGTKSKKGDDTKKRPHRTSKIVSAPDIPEIVPAETLKRLAALLPEEPAEARIKPSGKSRNDNGFGNNAGKGIVLGEWLRDNGIEIKTVKPWNGGTMYTLYECPFSDEHKDGAFAIQFESGAIFAGCHHNSCGSGVQRWPELRAMYEGEKRRGSFPGKKSAAHEGRREKTINSLKKSSSGGGLKSGFSDEIREKAAEVLRTGDPLSYMLDVFEKFHVGDRIVAECLIMSVASQSVENTKGLHVSVSGNSGKGKSHACNSMLKLIPEDYHLSGTVSDKALYYNPDLRPGTVFLFDDVSLSEDLQEVLKSATANFCDRIEHQTLTTDRQLKICSIPERCVWWLAKVETVGDDQVMNRMLTTWIDDSAEQDERVLLHIRKTEASENITVTEPEEAEVCRCMWSMLKEENVYVSIPYAEKVQFSSSANRRNPAILFDLIKCHALLFRMQRESFGDSDGQDSGSGSENLPAIRADLDDFREAARIYAQINGVSGGQETKLSRNEAAALNTICKMGWDVLTIRMLQDAMGLSYHQARRIFQGYTNGGSSYSGLLEKCPAISYIDATVSQEMDGCMVRRRESRFSFSHEIYHKWNSGSLVWIDDDAVSGDDGDDESGGECGPDDKKEPGGDTSPDKTSDVCTVAPSLQRVCTGLVQTKSPPFCEASSIPSTDDEMLLSNNSSLHQNSGAEKTYAALSSPSSSVRVFPASAIKNEKGHFSLANSKRAEDISLYGCTSKVHDGANQCKSAYLPGVSSGAGKGFTLPLPGVMCAADFERVSVDLGRCGLCDEGKALFRSGDLKLSICEKCYGRLLREENGGKGVV